MSKVTMSASSIHRATILHGIEVSQSGEASTTEVAKIIRAPEGYPISGALNNMKRTGVLATKKEKVTSGKQRPNNVWYLTKKGREYLDVNSVFVQEFGDYKECPKGTHGGSKKQQNLELIKEPQFSSAVQAAMRELEAVASINEQARGCLKQIKQAIESYRLINAKTDFDVHGALAAIQSETISINKAIDHCEALCEQVEG